MAWEKYSKTLEARLVDTKYSKEDPKPTPTKVEATPPSTDVGTADGGEDEEEDDGQEEPPAVMQEQPTTAKPQPAQLAAPEPKTAPAVVVPPVKVESPVVVKQQSPVVSHTPAITTETFALSFHPLSRKLKKTTLFACVKQASEGDRRSQQVLHLPEDRVPDGEVPGRRARLPQSMLPMRGVQAGPWHRRVRTAGRRVLLQGALHSEVQGEGKLRRGIWAPATQEAMEG
mgnify:CR=1 FL=1